MRSTGGSSFGELDTIVDLDQELIADRAKNRSILPFVVAARGLAWINRTPSTAQALSSCEDTNADPRSTRIAFGEPAGHQPGSERGLEPEHVLAGAPPPADQHAGVIIDKPEQHRPSRRGAGQGGAVQPVPGPQLVALGGLEATIDLSRPAAVRADIQPLARKVRLQRPQPRQLTHRDGGEHDLPDLRRGPLRPLPLQVRTPAPAPRVGVRGTETRGWGTSASNPP